jgi:phosphoribosyl 1,2-cyclic phosphodiesterase
MQVTFWGTRGSIAKAGPTTVRFGGNTSCVEVRSASGTLIVLDCGTGAHELGQRLSEPGSGPVNGHVLISHTHWDHIQGLPFFAPLFGLGNVWHVYGPRGLDASLRETLAGQMQYAYFPVTAEDFAASVEYHDLTEGTFEIGDVRVTAQYLNHPALTLGYRLEADGVTIVYSSDHEPHDSTSAVGGALPAVGGDARHVAFLAGADLVIHDAQYLAREYYAKVGWGHSTVEYALEAAAAAGVHRLALFHHDPTRNDDAVDLLLEQARAHAIVCGYVGEVFAATEGHTLVIGDSGSRTPSTGQPVKAMQTPALAQLARNVVLAVHDPAVREKLRAAAQAEGLHVLEAAEGGAVWSVGESLPSSVFVLEAEADGSLPASIDSLQLPGKGDGVGDGVEPVVVVVTSKAPPYDDSRCAAVTDWLVWPSTSAHIRTKLRAWMLRQACRWQTAPLPPDETRRLEALRQLAILDTGPEERFDRITQLACATFEVPIALVSLVDEGRQWFKSRQGIAANETPRDMAVCAHAILHDDVLQIPDAFEDPRFADNPLVLHDPRVRFYAGVPLTLLDGSRVGTLCVIDHRPRNLDEAQLERLRELAKLVEGELAAGLEESG